MRVVFPAESDATETRVAATPDSIRSITALGLASVVQAGLGERLGWSDTEYQSAGATILPPANLFSDPALVCTVQPPPPDLVTVLPPGSMYAGFLDPFNRTDLVRAFADARVSAMSMEMVPRTTRAQKLDALSSQHNIAGYYMAVLAAETLGRVFPMMATPAGILQPARVLVIGAGVAGLQAIATAKRLGARIEAFDTRPAVKEQVESLGARFIDIDLGTPPDDGVYAAELSPEQREKQQEGMTRAIERADAVITTAAIFGKPAPTVITSEMIARMKPGSLIIDYAVSSGGNVQGSVPDQTVDIGGVRVLGLRNFPGRVAVDASRMYANNIAALVGILTDPETKTITIKLEDDIIAGCLLTHEGRIVNNTIRQTAQPTE